MLRGIFNPNYGGYFGLGERQANLAIYPTVGRNNSMKTLIFLSTFIFFFGFSQAQTQYQIDSVITIMCTGFEQNQNDSDSIRVEQTFQRYLYSFITSYEESTWDSLFNRVFVRFQRQCKEFKHTIDRMYPPKGDWEILDEKPTSLLSKKKCRKFTKYEDYQYIESSGDTVNLSIKNNIFTDHFNDGTYSKLKFHWLEGCEFEIEFIESSNLGRASFSKTGDRYRYILIDKNKRFYSVSVESTGIDSFMKFKIYY